MPPLPLVQAGIRNHAFNLNRKVKWLTSFSLFIATYFLRSFLYPFFLVKRRKVYFRRRETDEEKNSSGTVVIIINRLSITFPFSISSLILLRFHASKQGHELYINVYETLDKSNRPFVLCWKKIRY